MSEASPFRAVVFDWRGTLVTTLGGGLVDASTLSFEHGTVKPDPALCAAALAGLGTTPGVELMLEQVDTGDRLHPEAEMVHPHGRGMNLSIDVEAVHAALLDAGHQVRHPPQERWYARTHDEVGTRELTVADPEGYLLRPTQDIGTRPRRDDPAA